MDSIEMHWTEQTELHHMSLSVWTEQTKLDKSGPNGSDWAGLYLMDWNTILIWLKKSVVTINAAL